MAVFYTCAVRAPTRFQQAIHRNSGGNERRLRRVFIKEPVPIDAEKRATMSDFQRETDFKREGAVRELQILRKQEESKSMFAIIMAGIAGLFIMAVVAAYNYTSDTSVAQNPLPPSQASGGSSARIPGPPAETTGSASTEKPVQVTPSKSQQN